MTPFQLAVLAQAPCSSTMAGLGPLPGTARAVVWAEAIWLRETIRAAMATARAGMMRRGLAWRAARAMFTVSSLSGMPSVRSVALEALTGKSLFRLCRRKLSSGIRNVTAVLSIALDHRCVKRSARSCRWSGRPRAPRDRRKPAGQRHACARASGLLGYERQAAATVAGPGP